MGAMMDSVLKPTPSSLADSFGDLGTREGSHALEDFHHKTGCCLATSNTVVGCLWELEIRKLLQEQGKLLFSTVRCLKYWCQTSISGAPLQLLAVTMEGERLPPIDELLEATAKVKPALAPKSTKPKLPDNFTKLLVRPRLRVVKQFIGAFEYRHNSQTNFNAHKLRPLSRIMDTARMIIYAPQPIKCVEAVFLALYLTSGLPEVERIPLGFKTELGGQVYQHIVLLVQLNGKYGAFGISRCPDLMHKDLIFDSMSSIIGNYKRAYEDCKHTVLKIRVGLPVEHNILSPNFVCWRHLSLNLRFQSWPQCVEEIEKHSTKGKRLWDLWLLAGKGGDPHRKSTTRKAPLDNKLCDPSKKKKTATQDVQPVKGTGQRISLESQVVAPLLSAIGNTKFRQAKSTGSSTGETEAISKPDRPVLRNRIRSRNLDQTLAVTRSLLKSTRISKGTVTSKTATLGPKLVTRRKFSGLSRSSLCTTLARLPSRVTLSTLERGKRALFTMSTKKSVAG